MKRKRVDKQTQQLSIKKSKPDGDQKNTKYTKCANPNTLHYDFTILHKFKEIMYGVNKQNLLDLLFPLPKVLIDIIYEFMDLLGVCCVYGFQTFHHFKNSSIKPIPIQVPSVSFARGQWSSAIHQISYFWVHTLVWEKEIDLNLLFFHRIRKWCLVFTLRKERHKGSSSIYGKKFRCIGSTYPPLIEIRIDYNQPNTLEELQIEISDLLSCWKKAVWVFPSHIVRGGQIVSQNFNITFNSK